jgi:hypothetical protein
MLTYAAIVVAPRRGVPRRNRTPARPGLFPKPVTLDRAASSWGPAWLHCIHAEVHLACAVFFPAKPQPSRPAAFPVAPKRPDPGRAGSFPGQNASFCAAQEVLRLEQQRSTRHRKFYSLNRVVLTGVGSFIAQTASFCRMQEDLSRKQRRFGRSGKFHASNSIVPARLFAGLGRKPLFSRHLPVCTLI